MVTLQQVYDRVGAGLAGAARTGQTVCWDASGTAIACAGTGQDGLYQAGVSVSPRFTDNANGTVNTYADLNNLSRTSLNTTLYYNDGVFQARIAGAFRSKYIVSINPGSLNDQDAGRRARRLSRQ